MKAVIAAAGLGTRFLPYTKATPKELLPIIDKPVIQVIVEDLVKSGVDEVIIVTSEGKEEIEGHFTVNPELNKKLTEKGKDELVKELAAIESLAKFKFVYQSLDQYGTAVPLWLAKDLLDDEPFFYYYADDFYRCEVPQPQQLVNVHRQNGSGSVISLIEVDMAESSLYGMIDADVDGETIKVKSFIEKPSPEESPSNMAMASGFLLTPDIFDHMDMDEVGDRGEYDINPHITRMAQDQAGKGVYGCIVKGIRHDTGKKIGYLQAIVDMALEDPKLGKEFRAYLKQRLNK